MKIEKQNYPIWDLNKENVVRKFPNSFTLGHLVLNEAFFDHCWVADVGGEFAGFAWIKEDLTEPSFYEVSVAVDTKFHNANIAKSLIKVIQCYCIKNDIYGLIGIVRDINQDYRKAVFILLEKCDFIYDSESSRVWYSDEENKQFHNFGR